MSATSNAARIAGDAYFMAMNALAGECDIIITCELLKPLSRERAILAYERLLFEYDDLTQCRVVDKGNQTWVWGKDPSNNWVDSCKGLVEELRNTGELRSPVEFSDRLPMRLAQCDDSRLVFHFDHTFTNGRGGFFWIERFFALLDNRTDALVLNDHCAENSVQSALTCVRQATASTIAQGRARWRLGGHRRDLRLPLLNTKPSQQWRTERRSWSVPTEAFESWLRNGDDATDKTTSECLTHRLIVHFLNHQPSLAAVPLQIAADLHDTLAVEPGTIGNYTAVVTGYFSRDDDIATQVRDYFAALRGGAAAGQGLLLGASVRGVERMATWFRNQLGQAVTGTAGAFMDPLLTVSNVGRINGAHTSGWLRSASMATTTPSIYLSCITVNETTTFEVSLPAQLFDSQRVLATFDNFFEMTNAPVVNPLVTASITPRRFKYQPDHDFPVNWNGGDAFRTQSFNAISFLFPEGEKWIVNTSKRVLDTLPPEQQRKWEQAGRDFIAQESSHRVVHRAHNQKLLAQGLTNWIDGRAKRRTKWGEQGSPINQLASTVAYEYLTGVFSASMVGNPKLLNGADTHLAQLWYWHACEELEHKNFVFDLYRAAQGGEARRIAWFVWALTTFMADVHYQVYLNLRATGDLWKWRTLGQALRVNFGYRGSFWAISLASIRFMNPWFKHKDNAISIRAERWLAEADQGGLAGMGNAVFVVDSSRVAK